MENSLACVKCKTLLPQDKPAEKRSVRCIFCGCPNPNPSLPTETRLFETPTSTDKRKRVIKLEQSSLSNLLSQAVLWVGIVLFIYLLFRRTSTLTYLYASLVVLIPTIRSSFVNSHWKKTLVWLSSRSQERYGLNYEVDNTIYFIVSFLYMFLFTSHALYNFAPRFENIDRYIFPAIMATITSYGIIWFATKVIYIVGEVAGKIFSRKV